MKKIIALIVVVIVGCASPQKITKDKYYHFAAGGVSALTANETNLPEVSSAFIAGFAKESYDYIRYGTFDTKDLVATTFGGLVVKYIIKLLKKKKDVKIDKKVSERRLDSIMEQNYNR